MTKLKRTAALLLCFAMIFMSFAGCGAKPAADTQGTITEGIFKPGKYEGEGKGYGGKIKVEVEVDANKILSVKVLEHKESAGVSDGAFEKLPTAFVEQQSVAVDTVAGCTFSSKGIIEAVKNALEKTGVDMKQLEKKAEVADTEKKEVEKTAEVVIIGGGGAGLAAAESAYENGAKSVILLEKAATLGGNTIRAGGAYNAVNPEKQKAQGIEDSIEKHIQQTYEGGHKVGNMELIKVLCNNAYDGVTWLEGLGLQWQDKIGSVVGSMWQRSNQTVAPLGTGYIETLSKAATAKGCEILLDTKANELIIENGRVVGVKAEGPDSILTVKAEKGVIVATGGYAANPEMVRQYLSDGVYTKDNLPADVVSTNAPGIVGDGIKMGEAIGAQLIDMQHIQLLPMPSDRFGPSINVEHSFFINKEGKRFVKEDGARDEICLATFEQKDGQYFMINDSKIIPENRKTLSGEDLNNLIEKGLVVEANSLDELAEKIGVPADALKKTTETFNSYVASKSDADFGRKVWGEKIDKAPFYATLRFPALHHTMGGLKINTKTEVLDKNDQPIPGLYAAGEVTGGIHGANRLGGNAIADIIVFGRIAGATVMGK